MRARKPAFLPARPVERVTRPVLRFLELEAAGGAVLLACTLVALAAANSGWADDYRSFWDTRFRVGFGGFGLDYPLWYWVNDGLMTLFFFVIGLEIKREVVHGELRDPRRIATPVAAALGGALVPALIFLGLLGSAPGRQAWAVPMATDIAFVVGALAVLGPRVSHGLKVMVLTLAIVDDILAVVVIAAFYSSGIDARWLAAALAGIGLILGLNRAGVRTVTSYVLVGAAVWLCTLKSGIHPTVAGVVLGLLTPASAWLVRATLVETLQRGLTRIRGVGEESSDPATEQEVREVVHETALVAREAVSPLERLEDAMHYWVAFAIMPVFALANAGVVIGAAGLGHPLAVAIAGALVLGKPIGIVAGTWIAVRTGSGMLPEGTSWRAVLGAGLLAGVGFTMSLFVASLALEGPLLETAKGGILLGSAIALAAGLIVLSRSRPRADFPATPTAT